MLALEWWTFELLTLMAGYISVACTAGEIILANLSAICVMIPMGV